METRPSEFVSPVAMIAGAEVEKGVVKEEGDGRDMRVTGMEAPGRPSVVSRTWQLIAGRGGGSAMVFVEAGPPGEGEEEDGVRCVEEVGLKLGEEWREMGVPTKV